MAKLLLFPVRICLHRPSYESGISQPPWGCCWVWCRSRDGTSLSSYFLRNTKRMGLKAETDASFLVCIFKHQQGRENCCKNPGASSWDSPELSQSNTERWRFEHWKVRPEVLGSKNLGAGACECTRLLSDTEHWHHLSRGFCPLITSAINHQALLPDADGLGRGKKNVLSRPGLSSSNFACVEKKALFPPCIWDVRSWPALWRGRNILEHCSETRRGIHLWVVQEELLVSAPWPFRIMVCPWPLGNLPSTRSIHPNPTELISAHLKVLFLVRHCKHWDPAAPTEQINWKTLCSLQQLLPSKAFCKVRVPETKILSSLVFCDNFHRFTENPTQLCTPGCCPCPPPAAELLGQLSCAPQQHDKWKTKQSGHRKWRIWVTPSVMWSKALIPPRVGPAGLLCPSWGHLMWAQQPLAPAWSSHLYVMYKI